MKAGWKSDTLGNTCEMYQPRTISAKDMVQDGPFPVFGANGVIGRYDKYNHEEPQLLVGCRGACGTVNMSEPKSWITGNAMVVRPKDDSINLRFLEYVFRGGLDISTAITGAAQPQITRTNLAPLRFAFPEALEEQQRIVTLLDEAFGGISTARVNAQKNVQNARAVFESFRDSMFTKGDSEWVEKRLDEVAEFSQGIQIGLEHHSKAPADGLVRFIRIIDYTQGTDDVRYVRDPGPRYWVKESDIVMVRYGTPGLIGRGIEGVIANNLFKISIRNGSVTNDYLAAFLLQSKIQCHLRSQGASTMPALTFKQLGVVNVVYPTNRDHQDTITAALDALSDQAKRLESIYQQKVQALDELKKSLLHQAFTGQL